MRWFSAGIELDRLLKIAWVVQTGYVVLLLVCSLAERLFGAWRWLLRDHHSAISFGAVLRLTFLSALVGVLLPGAVGTYAVRAYGIARITSDLGISVASLVADRLIPISFAGLGVREATFPSTCLG